MKVRALRGVCIGVDRNLAVGNEAELDPATGKFLASIGAVEEVKPPPPAPAPEPIKPETSSEKSTTDAAAAGEEATDTASSESSPDAAAAGADAEGDEPAGSDSSGGANTQPRRGRRK